MQTISTYFEYGSFYIASWIIDYNAMRPPISIDLEHVEMVKQLSAFALG